MVETKPIWQMVGAKHGISSLQAVESGQSGRTIGYTEVGVRVDQPRRRRVKRSEFTYLFWGANCMDGIQPTAKKLHPLVATAAFAVIVVSVLGAIVIITDQVAAHKGPDATVVASNDTTAPAAQPATPDTASPAEKPLAPLPAPAQKVTHTPPKPRPSAPVAGAGSLPPPPPPGAAAVPPEVAMAAPPAPPVCNDCGIVAAVRPVKTQGQGSGVGAVAGGAAGGLVGNQFGSGNGKTAMTILGVIGGALGGNQVEKEVKSTTQWYVDVRLDNGQLRTIAVPGNPGPIVGTRVRIQNGQLVREAPPTS
jgi:outer membrane lipoprotein SlyB